MCLLLAYTIFVLIYCVYFYNNFKDDIVKLNVYKSSVYMVYYYNMSNCILYWLFYLFFDL